MSSTDDRISEVAATTLRGTIVAAAGCGKTEQVVRATARSEGRRLILTHTHAGVDALKARLARHHVAEQRYHVDTIAGWALRLATAFPRTSGIRLECPSTNDDWNAVYESAFKLIRTGAISRVIKASYVGLFVDEYQDCTLTQHELICALADVIPTCLFGDPLQAIFGFRGNRPVNWATDVFPQFPKVGELLTPWRWRNSGNTAFADWLERVRGYLERGLPVNLVSSPNCVQWCYLPPDAKTPMEVAQRQKVVIDACRSVNVKDGQSLIVIGDSANLRSRANLAKNLSKLGFSNIEPVGCVDLVEHAARIQSVSGLPRLEAVLTFAGACMTGTEKKELLDAVESHMVGRKKGAAKFGEQISCAINVVGSDSWVPVLTLLEAMRLSPHTHIYRREMFFAMSSALHTVATAKGMPLAEAIWETQNRLRHIGRRLGKRSIGSTLLVKGLEFDHSVVVDADRLTRNDLYVALTRSTRSLLVLSRSREIAPRP